jgi:site-specific DNA recombinase
MNKEIVKKRIAINPEEAEIVRLIYRWYVADMGAKAIAERLNRDGYSYRGKPWCKYRVLDVIGDEAYIGKYYYNRRERKTRKMKPRGEWIPMSVEPIVEEGVWQRANDIREARAPIDSSRNPAVVGSKTLLTGLAICGLCGARMSLETAKGGKFAYYNCSNYLRRGKSTCVGQRIPSAGLEQAILDHLENKLFTKDRVRDILKGICAEIKNMDKGRDGQRKSLLRQYGLINGKLTKQYEAIESGVIALDQVAERIRELQGQRSLIKDKLDEIKSHTVIPIHLFREESLEGFRAMIKGMFLGEDRAATKAYLRLFIEKIVINQPRIDITCKSSVLLAALENKTAARSCDALAADMYWLPSADSNHGPDG